MPARAFVFAALLAATWSNASAETVRVGGTGAAQGLMQRLGQAFSAASPGDRLDVVPGLGSSGGIAAVTEGALALAVAARRLKDVEATRAARGEPWLETPFMFVSSSPQTIELSRLDVVAIYRGGLRSWPDGSPIRPILRPRSDSVTDVLIAGFEGMKPALEVTRKRPDVPVAATDQDNLTLAQRVAHSFAATTLLQFITERPAVGSIKLDGVEPSLAHMEDGSYLLRVVLHLVIPAQISPGTQRFLDFVRTPTAERIIRESGGLPLAVHSAAAR